ncbi:metabolite traffic protein EboE [Planctopirus hydrillae]|uniref:Xylose isomerase-like TIM barrel domain-containing protein n=1 Tax=Planctopirus hydrillae TaxID=1841610 RepID=A0A1C3E9L7_9PLAN|nr:metabolite traffic protein EboE [Planctopirus hydrillae]ODA29968.1 hypothetical protein A6X21_06395 [Planctopirus hydrillae]
MTFPLLPLSYCTNVHPAQTLAEVILGLDTFALPVRQASGGELAVGLWLQATIIDELLASPQALEELRVALSSRNLTCYTLNAFPYGNFHSERVKDQVYLPDWSSPRRYDYTLNCARILAALLPEDLQGSLSTLPLAFKPHEPTGDFQSLCIRQLLDLAMALDDLHDSTGRLIRLAIEPEPLCLLETTDEAIAFFEQLFRQAEEKGMLSQARTHLGLCYDVCHQAVEFEPADQAIHAIERAGIRINKVHLSCAIDARQPLTPEVQAALKSYVEPRYLHQTIARCISGDRQESGFIRQTDLTEEFLAAPPLEFQQAESWRVHYHVPISEVSIGPLFTTRPDLEAALKAIEGLPYAPHLEVETYTWNVLPGQPRTEAIIAGLGKELETARELIGI